MNSKKILTLSIALSSPFFINSAYAESEAAAYDRNQAQYEGEPTSQDPNALASSIEQSVEVADQSVVFPTANQAANYDDMEAVDARINTGAPTDWSQPQY